MAQQLKWGNHSDLAIVRKPSVGREEFLDYMTFKRNDRPLFTELFGPIIGLKEEWEAQGATPAELDFSAFRYRCHESGGVPVNTWFRGGRPEEVIEETADHKIYRDGWGRTMHLPKAYATLALPMDFPVKTMDDWLKLKPGYLFSEARLASDWEAAAHRLREQGKMVTVSIPGGFDEPRQLMGEEALCLAYYDQPELIHDMLDTIGAMAFQVLERVSSKIQVDSLSVHDDMAGKSGSLAGPRQIAEFIKPYYRRIWEMLSERGARLFEQDSDGNMNGVIDALLDCGINSMHPLEPGSGMDIVQIREKYGRRLAFQGGLDKYVLRKSQADIERELEYKLPPMIRTGGAVLSLDHRIPNGSPLENYRFYIRKVWEIIERETG
jgi:uroporphyrinogen-III decarboxylase